MIQDNSNDRVRVDKVKTPLLIYVAREKGLPIPTILSLEHSMSLYEYSFPDIYTYSLSFMHQELDKYYCSNESRA